jgi:hypothetical protein
MRIMFGTSLDLIEEKDLVKPGAKDPPFLATMGMFADNFLITKHFPIIANIAQLLPMSLAQVLLPGYALFRQVSVPAFGYDKRNNEGLSKQVELLTQTM